jgi:hypothetical protein
VAVILPVSPQLYLLVSISVEVRMLVVHALSGRMQSIYDVG